MDKERPSIDDFIDRALDDLPGGAFDGAMDGVFDGCFNGAIDGLEVVIVLLPIFIINLLID